MIKTFNNIVFGALVRSSFEEKLEALDRVLRTNEFEVFSNFSPSHGLNYINRMLRYELDKITRTPSLSTKFWIYSENLREDIFDKMNIELLSKLSKSGDVRILVKNLEGINNHKLSGVTKSGSIGTLPSFLINDTSFAVESLDKTVASEHKALFYINVDSIVENSKDSYLRDVKRRFESEFDSVWELS